MSEKSKGFETPSELGLFQVVNITAREGLRRCVIVEILPNPDFIGTSEIINEGTGEERLSYAGTSPVAILEPTDEVWDQARVVDGLINTFGRDRPGVRSKVEEMFLKG